MFTILQQVPQLESLTLSDCMTFVTIAFMEQLHDTCPRLKQLVIPAENIQSINDTTVPMETIETVEPARAMERLSMGQYYRSGPALPVFADADAFTGPWFTYITHKYPALKSLTFPSPRFNYTPPNESEDRPNQASSSIVLQDFFPQLHELSLSVFANKPSTAWPQLVRGIQKISLCDDPAAGFSEWISNEATNSLKRLSLSSLPDDLNALRHCPQLQELELGWSRDEESKIKMMLDKRYEVNVDIVLSCCPKLKKLTIASGNLCYDGVNASTTKASLTTMVVKYSVIASNALLDHIGQRCPELVHLDLNDCMWIITDKDPIIRIDLTQHWLTYFRMIDPRVYRETPGSYSGGDQVPIAPNTLFMVKTPDCTVDNPQLFHCGQKNFRQRFVQQFSNPVIARWLNASLGDESDDNSTLHNEAMEVIASLKSDISPYMDYVAQFLELGSENYECAATVLRCHRINRLYYKNRRLCPNPQGSFYAYYC